MANESDPLSRLQVLDRLEVGPVQVGPDRIVAPYQLTTSSSSSTTELVFRYEEPVFDPDDEAHINMASMIAAQVALNYGLFCGEIVFHGPLDPIDERFLEEMAQNTAREIYVNKILGPNVFLTEEIQGLPPLRRSSYLQSRLVFPDGTEAIQSNWNAGDDRVAVLSSGGKDSLLSYGLLGDCGLEPHAIFINESGRHWYSALKAYRHLRSTRPQTTARVWTTADRVFAWMLRQLPFVRPDFHRVRADIYPIRLWTVAVFLFGALPILQRRGIGRLVIGNEYDTTREARHKGIRHYAGLYDQSRFFDVALSRYYQRKGWDLSQFSILRPLSEILVEKILASRYPDLHAVQVSCHAAHLQGDLVLPCGRCEKCRRIVGILVALDEDPSRCGYTEDQIERCLKEAWTKGFHQGAEDAEHLSWLLFGTGGEGRIHAPPIRTRPHEEVQRLRFHRRRSPMDSVPTRLRRPIYSIMLEYAKGAVRRSGRLWVPFDLMRDAALDRPYRFERRSEPKEADPLNRAQVDWTESGILLGEMNWPQAESRLQRSDTALLPVGALEQHGPHLPLDLDAWDADYLCRQVAERCGDPKPLVLPLIPYGVSYQHDDFPGTLSVRPETLASLIYEIGMSAARNGITKLVIVNGHGGNLPALKLAAQEINRDAHIFTSVDTGETSDVDVAAIADTDADLHAGEIETSTTLATRPHLVHMESALSCVPRFSSEYLDFTSTRSVEWFAHTERISPSGVLGDPTIASREKGERIWEIMIQNLVEFVEGIRKMTLDEIHDRRL